jgi:hypothetical protein
MDVLAAKAAGLAADGHRVFPVNSGAKEPLHKGWQEEATTDVERVAALWRGRVPEANIGIRTGGDVLVIDVDIKKGAPGIANWERLMAEHGGQLLTRTVRTPSGGLHHYFAKPPELVIPNSAGRLGPGIDVRGDGGFVLAPGSIFNGEPYELLHPGPTLPAPEWLLTLLVASPNGHTGARYQVPAAPVLEGQRNDALFRLAASMRARGSEGAVIAAAIAAMNETQCVPPLSSDELEQITASAMAYPKGEQAGVIRRGAGTQRTLTRHALEGEPEHVSWLWHGWLPRGKLCVQDGDPGKGKSTILLDLAARITTGSAMPDGTPGLVGGGAVLVLMAEDGRGDTIIPRLIAAGADRSRVQALEPSEVQIPRDVDLLEEAIRDTKAVTVMFDPLNYYLGDDSVSTNSDKQVRVAMTPLVEMAQRTGTVIVGNRHLNKGGAGPAIYRGMGSIGIGGLARSVWCVADEPGEGDGYIFASVKHNLTKRPESLRYSITEVHLPTGSVSRIEWGDSSALTADDILGEDPAEAGALVSATRGLEALLSPLGDEGMALDDVKGWAKSEGHSQRTMERAKGALGVLSLKHGFEGWRWVLPPKGARVTR